jgi:hypothetical protein
MTQTLHIAAGSRLRDQSVAVRRESQPRSADGQAAIRQITAPVTTATGTRVAAIRLADPRVHALLAALCAFRLLPRGATLVKDGRA